MINTDFWKGKRVLLTGHTGFKGSWLSLWLTRLEAQVHGYALAPDTDPSLYQLAGVDALVESTIGDIRNRTQLYDTMAKVQPDIVFHLAAQPLVRESFKDPLTTLETNVMGTANLLESVRQCHSVNAVVIVTSDKCYQNNEWQWGYRENESLGGHDPYSASKACAELVAQSYRLSFMGDTGEDQRLCPVASARAGNVIGGGDWARDRLIPDVLSSLQKNENVVLRNPDAVRPWQHVLEPLAGYLMLAERLHEDGQYWAQAWNFGPHDSDARRVAWIVEQLIALSESSSSWQLAPGAQPHEAQQLKLDCSKARQLLNWTPVWSLDKCLEQIASWHSSWLKGDDMRAVSISAIENFMHAGSSS